jgi:hypothetical protein
MLRKTASIPRKFIGWQKGCPLRFLENGLFFRKFKRASPCHPINSLLKINTLIFAIFFALPITYLIVVKLSYC